jgi:putative FmdB family regulatory protein
MPRYKYLCQACNKKFSLVLSVAEHDKGRDQVCEVCEHEGRTAMGAFFATTSKKS